MNQYLRTYYNTHKIICQIHYSNLFFDQKYIKNIYSLQHISICNNSNDVCSDVYFDLWEIGNLRDEVLNSSNIAQCLL